MKALPNVFTVHMGCDPELFLSKEVGRVRKRQSILGSELVIPEQGLGLIGSQVVRDGVQIELHPWFSHCRANLSNQIQICFRTLRDGLVKHPGTKVDFRQVVTLTPGELNKLTPRARELGCMPSNNIYGRPHIQKDGTKFRERSAAGHIHLSAVGAELRAKPLVALLDMFVGNTMVLVDRDPLAAQRRKTYGRAGEYRTKSASHIEYRTLSNFWLHNYKLMSLAFGLAKVALLIHLTDKAVPAWLDSHPSRKAQTKWYNDTYWMNAQKEILSSVKLKNFELAINNNDFDLAMENYKTVVRPILANLQTEYGISSGTVGRFDAFVAKIREAELAGKTKNREYLRVWFPDDPMQHWLTKPEGHATGWENWLISNVPNIPTTVKAVMTIPVVEKTVAPTGQPYFIDGTPIYKQDVV